MARIHDVFMVNQTRPKNKKVPESCIQSAEFIIQALTNPALVWKDGQNVKPNVWMHFGSGKSYNITAEENVHELPNESNIDFNFDQHPPGIGEGVAFINIGDDNVPNGHYNMHFMAVLVAEGTERRGATGFVVSNLNENAGPIKMVSLGESDNMKRVSGNSPWKAEKDKYQKDNGGTFRIALLSTSSTRPMT
jgi:hypothetical protein